MFPSPQEDQFSNTTITAILFITVPVGVVAADFAALAAATADLVVTEGLAVMDAIAFTIAVTIVIATMVAIIEDLAT